MERDSGRVEIDRETLGAAVEETEELLALVDAAPRLPAEDPLDFVRFLWASVADGE